MLVMRSCKIKTTLWGDFEQVRVKIQKYCGVNIEYNIQRLCLSHSYVFDSVENYGAV